jgi:hypothetical protein
MISKTEKKKPCNFPAARPLFMFVVPQGFEP